MSIVVERGNSNTTSTTTATAATTAAAANHINGNSYGLDHHLIGRSGLGGQRVTCFSMYANGNKPPARELGAAGVGVGAGRKVVEEEDEGRSGESSSSTSSIGRNSDEESSAGRSSEAGDGEEVQSEYKGGALDSLEALEEVLPIKRSISQFYCGKSKSFTSLSDAGNCSSMKDIVKPENAYTRKRKNLLAYNNFWDKNRNGIRRNNSGGISKRAAGSRSSLALAASMGCTESNNNSDSSNSNSPSRSICLPPLPPQARRSLYNDSSSPPGQTFSPWRSFSLSDLQGATATPSISGIMGGNLGAAKGEDFRFWDMDPELLPVTPNEYGTFHAMDRALYSLLAVDLWRDPYESVQIMALWLWMERLGFKNLVLTILSMPPMLINKYADEALTCVKCVNDPQFVLSAEVNEIPATSRLVKKRITLQYFHENRPIVVKELRNVVTETCAMALQDVIEDAVKKHNAYESLVNSFSNLGFAGEASGDYSPANGASQEERTMFVTFSKGYPVAESEVTEFFTKPFGNCIEAFHMQPVRSDEQPLYARVVFSTPKVIDLILSGVTKAKFTINGKHLWMRKFVPKRKISFPRSRRP